MTDLYKKSGVDIEAGNETVRRIKRAVASTHTKEVLSGIGHFGGLYDIGKVLKKYKNPVLVQSIDGVGTKLIVARMMGRYDSVGEDIVGHSCGDIVAMGAKPLTFLDYVANEKLDPKIMEEIVGGMARACKEAGVALVGGETAEMPGTYMKGEHDIAGAIMGVVEKNKIITGSKIKSGDVILGFASSGLHTNGFSLARKILFEDLGLNVKTEVEELNESVGEALLKVHTNYTRPIWALLDGRVDVRGIAHITGGGFVDNIPRILPKNLNAEIEKGTWPVLPIFQYLQKVGHVSESEMYQAFNMGIGMVVVIPEKDLVKTKNIIKKFKKFKIYQIGKITKGSGVVKLI